MCGIAGAIGLSEGATQRALAALRHRGPDGEGVWTEGDVTLGHVRLAIIDPTPASAQPFSTRAGVLVYNGELWNYRDLRARLEARGVEFTTTGDTEVLAQHLAAGLPLEDLDGMFAFAWFERGGEEVLLARDRFGEVPLHVALLQGATAFASERKALLAMGAPPAALWDVPPGAALRVTSAGIASRRSWYEPPIPAPGTAAAIGLPAAGELIRTKLGQGTAARTISDVPVCTLLSGGIDSAAIALHLLAHFPNLVAYTAVFDERSRDLKAARMFARKFGIELREVRVPAPNADDLARVVHEIELPHKAQVEIGWACLRLAERMRADGFKVTYSGEGSDELWASYGFAYHALAAGKDWHAYRRELFVGQARKNFMRANKVFMARSVECRLPFLHFPLVEAALALPIEDVAAGRSRPKAVLQFAYGDLLPDAIVRRPKLAFQDGMGLKDACASAVADPRRYYLAEYARTFGGHHG